MAAKGFGKSSYIICDVTPLTYNKSVPGHLPSSSAQVAKNNLETKTCVFFLIFYILTDIRNCKNQDLENPISLPALKSLITMILNCDKMFQDPTTMPLPDFFKRKKSATPSNSNVTHESHQRPTGKVSHYPLEHFSEEIFSLGNSSNEASPHLFSCNYNFSLFWIFQIQ